MNQETISRLDEIIADYLREADKGTARDWRELIIEHPDLADELAEFFADHERFRQLARPLNPGVASRPFVPARLGYFGDYELLEEIARGGMGVVYRARQTTLNRIVAVKMIASGHLATDDDVKRFHTEAEAAANLRHPAIVAIHEVGMQEGRHYFSMDYVDGPDLGAVVRDKPPGTRQAAAWVRQIAEAIHYAHQQGTLHRDLKPSNILVDAGGNIHITDFGLATRVDSDSNLTRSGQVLGTPCYMAPEQAGGVRSLIGPATDIYALGVMLYELLTGRPPFRSEAVVETLRQVIEAEPAAPRLLNRSIPRDLETICLKCLEKEPHKRYGTAALLAEDLGRFLDGQPIVARPIGRLAKTWRWCLRRPVQAGLLAVTALLLVATALSASLGYYWASRALAEQQQKEQAEQEKRAAQTETLVQEALRLGSGARPDFPRAVELLSQVIEERPDQAVLYARRGSALYELGRYAEAIADLQRAVEIDPDAAPAAPWLLVAALQQTGQAEAAAERARLLTSADAESVPALITAALTRPPDDTALALLTRAIDRDVSDPRLYLHRGRTAYRLLTAQAARPHYELAVNDLEKAFAGRPYDTSVLDLLSRTLVQFHFLAQPDDRPLTKARSLLERFDAQEPDSSTPRALLAEWHLCQGDEQAAIKICLAGQQRWPDCPDFPWLLGEAYQRLGQRAEAMAAYQRCVECGPSQIRPASVAASARLAVYQAKSTSGDYGDHHPLPESLLENLHLERRDNWTFFDWQAVADLFLGADPFDASVWADRWAKSAPYCGPAHYARAMALDRQAGTAFGRSSAPLAAMDALGEAIRLAPSLAAAYFERGRLGQAAELHGQASADYEQFLQLAAGSVSAEQADRISRFLLDCPDAPIRNPRRAIEVARMALARDPQRTSAWLALGQAHRLLGEPQAAVEALDKVIERESHVGQHYLQRAELHREVKRFDKALEDYEQAQKIMRSASQPLAPLVGSLVLHPQGDARFWERAVHVAQEAAANSNNKISDTQLGAALYRAGRWDEAVKHLTLPKEPHAGINGFFLAMAYSRQGRQELAHETYSRSCLELLRRNSDDTRLALLRSEAAEVLGISPDATQAALAGVARHNVGRLDWPQWGGWSGRNNTPQGTNIPSYWDVGSFDRNDGRWHSEQARNIKWVAEVGSQTYGTPVVAHGRIFLGTNNAAGYLKRYPPEVDLGCLICFRESDGQFLWQHSSEKLPTGRVHDWPLQGVCSTPLVEGDRLWFVTNRCEVVCLDPQGFYDGEDDGPVQAEWIRLFEINALVQAGLNRREMPAALREALVAVGADVPPHLWINPISGEGRWEIGARVEQRPRQWTNGEKLFDVRAEGDKLHVYKHVYKLGAGADQPPLASIDNHLLRGLGRPGIVRGLESRLKEGGINLPEDLEVRADDSGRTWSFEATMAGQKQSFRVRWQGDYLRIEKRLAPHDLHEADVVWKLDLMNELDVSPHNMSTCCVTSWGDTLFVCTSNGVDETHLNIPKPEAPSFIALDKHTGRLLWSDKSPGENILHGQWSAPVVGLLGGVPQVIFGGGDGWLYSFHAERWADGKPELLWKFDCNPKESKWMIGGRGTRNNIIAIPVLYDGLVYVVVGQDPEHGEGDGHLWCIDPTRRGDVSPQLAVHVNDRTKPIPHKRLQAVVPEAGEVAIDNPNSAVVWHYDQVDRNADGRVDFEETFHRGIGSVAIKNDLLFVADFSGLVHCLNARTGRVYWTYDMLAASWSSPLIVDDKVYFGDEDGDMAIFELSGMPRLRSGRYGLSRREYVEPIAELNMGNSVYTTPIVANNVLYIVNKTHLFAIGYPEEDASR